MDAAEAVERRLAALELDGIPANFGAILPLAPAPAAAYRRGLRELDRALRSAPRSTRLRALRGRLLTGLARYAEARRELGRSLSRGGASAQARSWLGQAHLLENRVDLASRELAAALALDPGCAWALFHRAAARTIGGQAAEARADLERVLAASSDAAPRGAALAFLGLLEAKEGRFAAASSRLSELRSLEPRAPWVHALRAVVHRLAGEREAAAREFGAALAGRPLGWVHRERASLYEELGEPRSALRDLEAARKLEGPGSGFWLRRGRLRLLLKRWKPAQEDLRRALREGATPEARVLALELAQALLAAGSETAARGVLRTAARRYPGDAELLRLLAPPAPPPAPDSEQSSLAAANRLAELGRLDQAAAGLRGALRRGVGVPVAARLGSVLLTQGKLAEAKAVLLRAARKGTPELFQTLGAVNEGLGLKGEAVEAYRKACALGATTLQPLLRLAYLLLDADDEAGADAALAEALRRAPPASAGDPAALTHRFQAAVCAGDLDEASRMGEAVLDRTRRREDLYRLSVPLLSGADGVPLSAALAARSRAAIAALDAFIARNPDSPWGYHLRLQWVDNLGGEQEEGRVLALGRFSRERYGWMLAGPARFLMTRRRFDEAIAMLEAARDACRPRDWLCQCMIAETLVCKGEAARGLRAFGPAERLDPEGRAPVLAWKAEMLLWLGRYAEALATLDSVPRGAESPYAACWRGAALSKLGRLRPALAALDDALARYPEDEEALVWRAETLWKSGKPAEALRDADAALACSPKSNHFAHAVRGLARAAGGDAAALEEALRRIPRAALSAAKARLGPGAAKDSVRLLAAVLDDARGLRRPDVRFAAGALSAA